MGGQQSNISINIDYDTNSIDLVGKNINTFTIAPFLKNKIKFLILARNQINSLPEGMTEIILLNLVGNKMKSQIPPQVVNQIITYSSLKSIYLSNNELVELNQCFRSPSLESMFLTQNRFETFPKDFFERFPQLRSLYLDCNFIQIINQLKSETLTSLSLSLNRIQTLNTETLSFPQLNLLDLSKNSIKTIPRDFSKSFPKLNTLNLSQNLIKEIPECDPNDDIFPKTLKELKLSYNEIEKVPNSVTSLPNLNILLIDKNKIKHLPKLPESIINLYASYNAISSIEEQSLPNLKEFFIDNNELTHFPTEIKTEKIESIYVHHNKIVDLDFKSLSNSVSLINISFNCIEKIPKEIFSELPNLQVFTAYFNRISEVPPEIADSQCLYYLDISYNPIKKLPKLPRTLSRISASNCQLTSFNENEAFADPKPITVTTDQGTVTQEDSINLTHADFSQNSLDSFPVFDSIQFLNLSQNHLKKLPTITHTLKLLDVSMNEIEISSDDDFEIAGNSLEELNLSFNKIEHLPSIKKLPFLQSLLVSGNPLKATIDVSINRSLEKVDITGTQRIRFVNNSDVKHEVITSPGNESNIAQKMLTAPILIVQKAGKSGYSEMLGLRDRMEDAVIVRDDLNLYAVCDGHGGSDTSNFASIHLSSIFDLDKGQSCTYEKAAAFVKSAFEEMNQSLKQQNYSDGSTVCLCLICEREGESKVVSAHLGDARALIVRKDGNPRQMTIDHKPSNRSEFERIRDEYGRLTPSERIDGSLAVARSIGDFSIVAVGREIELNEFMLNDDDRFLVICCDGVFDVLSNDDVAKIASSASSPYEAAFAIRNAAFGCGSNDNISTVVVDLTVK